MPQRPKPEIRRRILDQALTLFAAAGYSDASMAQIADNAGVAVGNLYRYFKNKDDLFAAVVPQTFVRQLFALMTKKVHALGGVDDFNALPPDAEYRRLSAEMLDFIVQNRLRIVVLTAGAKDSPLQHVPEKVVAALKALAVQHFKSVDPNFALTRASRVCLDLAYRNFIAAMSAVLARFKSETDIRTALQLLLRYHLTGLRAMLAEPETHNAEKWTAP